MNKGFTLIEFLVVISIMAILALIVVPNYQSIHRQFVLQRSASKIAQDIRRVQEMAMAMAELPGGGVPEGGYGVYFDKDTDDSYIIYADTMPPNNTRNPSGDEDIQIIYLDEEIKIESVAPSKTSINFLPPDPIVDLKDDAGGSIASDVVPITISLRSDSTKTKTIKINKAGLVDID